MNKRNFGAVIKAIEKDLMRWEQGRVPHVGETPTCGTPFCFLGHAEYLRTRKPLGSSTDDCVLADTYDKPELLKWLGLSKEDAIRVYGGSNGLSDFKRWHKAGRVS